MMDGKPFSPRPAKDSEVIMTQMVMPNDTNNLNKLMGGRLMHFIDIAGAISAQRHCNNIVVTASADNISFKKGIPLGSVITLKSKVTRSFNTSIEVVISVEAEDIPKGIKFKSNDAFFTFVAVNEEGIPVKVPEVVAESETEKLRYKQALRRRELRLILAGKIKPENASNLKELFLDGKN